MYIWNIDMNIDEMEALAEAYRLLKLKELREGQITLEDKVGR